MSLIWSQWRPRQIAAQAFLVVPGTEAVGVGLQEVDSWSECPLLTSLRTLDDRLPLRRVESGECGVKGVGVDTVPGVIFHSFVRTVEGRGQGPDGAGTGIVGHGRPRLRRRELGAFRR